MAYAVLHTVYLLLDILDAKTLHPFFAYFVHRNEPSQLDKLN